MSVAVPNPRGPRRRWMYEQCSMNIVFHEIRWITTCFLRLYWKLYFDIDKITTFWIHWNHNVSHLIGVNVRALWNWRKVTYFVYILDKKSRHEIREIATEIKKINVFMFVQNLNMSPAIHFHTIVNVFSQLDIFHGKCAISMQVPQLVQIVLKIMMQTKNEYLH